MFSELLTETVPSFIDDVFAFEIDFSVDANLETGQGPWK